MVSIRFVALVLLSFASTAQASTDPTKELFDYLEFTNAAGDAGNPGGFSEAPAKVQAWLDSGADLSKPNPWGANAFNLAAESYATAFSGNVKPESKDGLLQAFRLLLAKSPDISSPDERGVTPLHYLLRYGSSDGAGFAEEYLSHSPDLSRGGTILASTILGRATEPLFLKLVDGFRDLGIPLTEADDFGSPLLTLAGRSAALSSGRLPLEYVLSKLTPEERQTAISARSLYGETVFSRAVLIGNLVNVKYLLSSGLSIDLDQQTWDGLTPLMEADLTKNQEMISLLESHGAHRRVLSTELECAKENDVTMTVERVSELVAKCKLKSIDELLPLLPRRLRSRAVVTYKSHGLQEASVDFPRVLMFEPDGKFVASFNGDPSQSGFTDLEMIQYRQAARRFEIFNLGFYGKPSLSKPNPPECVRCHGADPRPFWDTWSLWAGARGGEMAQARPFFKYEQPAAKHFETLRQDPKTRYSNVFSDSNAYVFTEQGISTTGANNINYAYNYVTRILVGEKVAREARAIPALYPFRYALLGALSCHEPAMDFIPESARSAFTTTQEELTAATRTSNNEEFKIRLGFHASVFPGYPAESVGRYTRYSLARDGGRNFDPERIGAVRYIVENLAGAHAMDDWFRVFGDGSKNFYVEDLVTPWEVFFWREFLDPVADRELYDIYANALPKAYVGEPALAWLYYSNAPELKELCPKLLEKSLSVLAPKRRGNARRSDRGV